ncbi:hypothetical protein CW304_13820 [Bacillus sp. UFRGS-B20]|nr:hypothetical protein CW304_13820 [Bacillus sp. UFRGS-B20]
MKLNILFLIDYLFFTCSYFLTATLTIFLTIITFPKLYIIIRFVQLDQYRRIHLSSYSIF